MKIGNSLSQLKRTLLGAAIAIGVAGLAIAQPASSGDRIEVKGKIVQYSLTPRGAVDGLILADGTEIRLPQQVSTQVAFAVRPGDTVTIRGFRAAASPVMTGLAVTNDATGAVVDARLPVAPSQMHDESRIKLQLHDPDGLLNGVLLDDGIVVRMPPFDAAQHAAGLAIGSPLVVRGEGISTPLGKVIAAHEIGSNKTNLTKIDDSRFKHWMREIFAGSDAPTVAIALSPTSPEHRSLPKY